MTAWIEYTDGAKLTQVWASYSKIESFLYYSCGSGLPFSAFQGVYAWWFLCF